MSGGAAVWQSCKSRGAFKPADKAVVMVHERRDNTPLSHLLLFILYANVYSISKTSSAGKNKFVCDSRLIQNYCCFRMFSFGLLSGLLKCLEGVNLPTSDCKARRFVMDVISLPLSLRL